jgi:hypothetical protein
MVSQARARVRLNRDEHHRLSRLSLHLTKTATPVQTWRILKVGRIKQAQQIHASNCTTHTVRHEFGTSAATAAARQRYSSSSTELECAAATPTRGRKPRPNLVAEESKEGMGITKEAAAEH